MTSTTFLDVSYITLPYQGPQVNGPVQWARGDVAATRPRRVHECMRFCTNGQSSVRMHVHISDDVDLSVGGKGSVIQNGPLLPHHLHEL